MDIGSISGGKGEGLPAATRHRDKLLEFDSTSVRRTKVIDDESDYFRSDSRSVYKEEDNTTNNFITFSDTYTCTYVV